MDLVIQRAVVVTEVNAIVRHTPRPTTMDIPPSRVLVGFVRTTYRDNLPFMAIVMDMKVGKLPMGRIAWATTREVNLAVSQVIRHPPRNVQKTIVLRIIKAVPPICHLDCRHRRRSRHRQTTRPTVLHPNPAILVCHRNHRNNERRHPFCRLPVPPGNWELRIVMPGTIMLDTTIE